MSARLALVPAVVLLAACTCADPAPPAPPVAGAAAVGTQVVLLPSFEVRPAEDGRPLPTHVPAVAFTPDGAALVIGTAQGEVIEFDAATRAVRRRERFAPDAIHAVALDRGARALCWLGGGVLEARVPDTAEPLGRVEGVADARVLAVSPRGDLVALGRGSEVELRRLPGLDLVADETLHAAAVAALAFSPDGARLASAGEDGRLVVADARDGLAVLHETPAGEPLYAACWTPDGGAVLYGGREKVVDRLETAAWTRERLLQGQPFDVTTLGVSPDGARLALGDESCDVWIFDLATKQRLFHGKHHVECWLSAVAWAPDSETFLFGCRPNTLAAAPALFGANRVAEAVQDPLVQALVEEERALLAEAAEQAQDEALAADLRAEAVALAVTPAAPQAESGFPAPELGLNLASAGEGGGGVFAFDAAEVVSEVVGDFPGDRIRLLADGESVAFPSKERWLRIRARQEGVDGARPTSPGVRQALERVEEVRVRREAALKERVAELEGAFQVNVWRAPRR